MVVLIGAMAWASQIESEAPQRLMRTQLTSQVETPWGVRPKAWIYGFCFATNVRVGTVTDARSELLAFTLEDGTVYSKRPITTLTLASDADLRGVTGPTFALVVEGGTLDGTTFPPPPGAPSLQIGSRTLVAYDPMIPASLVRHPYPPETVVITAAIQLDARIAVDADDLRRTLDSACASIDFTTP